MSNPFSFLELAGGSLNFLKLDEEELRRVMPDAAEKLPEPQRIFLDDEDATPLLGFPVLTDARTERLRKALDGYLEQESHVQVAMHGTEAIDKKAREAAWERYRELLVQVTENTTRSSFGRRYTDIFWLYHSIAISRLFKELPQRVRRIDLESGREHGETIKYQVFDRFLDRVLATTYDTVHRVATETEEEERLLFPSILETMRDNLLILTEDHVGPDMRELKAYFRGCLELDPLTFRRQVEYLHHWHRAMLERDPSLRPLARHVTGVDPQPDPDRMLRIPGYLTFLADHRGYDRERLPDPRGVRIWENLLERLREFELLLTLRRMVIPIRREEEALVCQAPNLRSGGFLSRTVKLSESTRPFEFLTPWVVDPLVSRYGLIYDIADFSSVVSMLKYSGRREEDQSYRSIFRFQRRINQMARVHHLKLEKYLGDGALYSGREASRLLSTAIHLQRFYKKALRERFPFDRGIRMALNYGQYRLLPIEEGTRAIERRYEFFGYGIIELTRLVTGKGGQAIETVKRMLLSLGYEHEEVERFFRPLLERRVDLVDTEEEARDFYAYIDQSGELTNEGIVVTDRFVERVDPTGKHAPYRLAVDGSRKYVAFELDEAGGRIAVGLRRLGTPSLKGIESTIIYEVVDAGEWNLPGMSRLRAPDLNAALEILTKSETLLRQSGPQTVVESRESG